MHLYFPDLYYQFWYFAVIHFIYLFIYLFFFFYFFFLHELWKIFLHFNPEFIHLGFDEATVFSSFVTAENKIVAW